MVRPTAYHRTSKYMIMKIAYPDGSRFIGDRKWYFPYRETKGTHHFIVRDGSEEFKLLIGRKLAVPINSPKYFIL